MRKNFPVIAFILLCYSGIYGQNRFIVTGTIRNPASDTVKCVLNENMVVRQSRTFYFPLVNGNFRDTIILDRPTYFYLHDGKNYINGMIAPGEDIHIVYDTKDAGSSLVLSGSAREKFEWATAWASAKLLDQLKVQVQVAKEKPYPFDHIFSYLDSVQVYFLTKLQQINNLDKLSGHLLRGHVEGSIQAYKYSTITRIHQEHISQILTNRSQQLTPASRQAIHGLLNFSETYFDAPIYVNSLYNILAMHTGSLEYEKKLGGALSDKFRYLDSVLPGKLKVPVMTMFLEDAVRNNRPAAEIEEMITYVYAFPGEPVYREYIGRQLAARDEFKKGMKAPDFNLENERGEKLNLASFKGKVVYLDFWFAACGPCHQLFASVKPVKEFYKNNSDVVFLTISVDLKEEWKKALQKFRIGGYHAFTENRERRHPILSDYKVNEFPTTFIIDKNGNIFTSKPSQSPDMLRNQIGEALKL